MSTGYVYDPLYLEHNQVGHVECKERLEATMQVLREQHLLDRLVEVRPTQVSMDHLLEVHHEHYVKLVREVSERGGGHLDPDTYVNERSFDVALLAAGGLLNLVEAILNGEVANGFALVRPPGHHALRGSGMGFCLFNNVAVSSAHVLQHRGLSRVLIVDFDLHHGNGTQEIFYDTSQVLYFSTHQYPHYPGSGHWSEVGEGDGQGFTVNVPLPAGVGDEGYERVFDEILYPVAERYHPEIILVSVGCDAHWADPLGMMSLTTTGYAHLARTLKEMAEELCDGRLAFTLEGGYDLQAVSYCIAATLQALIGDEVYDPLGPAPQPSVPIDDLIVQIKGVHRLV